MAELAGIKTPELAWLMADEDAALTHARAEVLKREERLGQIRAELATRLIEGESVVVDEETEVVCVRGRGTNRSLDREAVLRHAEALEPLGLAPRETVKLEWPTVSQITGAEYAIQRVGVDPAELVVPGAPGALEVRVKQRKAEVVT